MTCKVAGCERAAQTRAGICRSHYDRRRRYGDDNYEPQPRSPLPLTVTCAYPHCRYPIHEPQPGFWVHFNWPFHVPDHLARPE